MPPSVLPLPVTSIVPVALFVNVLPPWIVPLFNCRVAAPVSVTIPPLIVELLTCSVLPASEIFPPALAIVVPNSNSVPPVASMVPVLVAPPSA